MSAFWRRRRRRPLAIVSRGRALTAVLALIGLLVITGAPGTARLTLRADDYNQMTGVGSTSSALTVNWTSGLLNSSNQPITSSSSSDGGSELSPNSDRSAATPASPLSFMDDDFKNLKVTVSQTEDIGHQGITVSWSGVSPPPAVTPDADFMQMMECYGDSDSGPSPEDCMYGSSGMLGAVVNGSIGDRGGFLCDSGAPGSTLPNTKPGETPTGQIGDPSYGCDPFEPAAETPGHCDTGDGTLFDCATAGRFYVPFVPVNGGDPLYQQVNLTQQFNEFSTNEVQFAPSNSIGSGQRQFQTLTAAQAPSLGCGAQESNGQTRNCWLVIVPRATYEPNGYKVSENADLNDQFGRTINTSPLSAANWAQRIQVHLSYAPLATNCPISVVPDATVGTQVVYRAVSSWQQALNQRANCMRVFSYTATTESSTTSQLVGGSAGLGFTTVPIGSEVTRDDPSATPPTLPTILYAPVAVTALDVGFNINQRGIGQVTTPINLTPALLARSLTQVYRYDLPDYVPGSSQMKLPGPTWAQSNPQNLSLDPEFEALNPEVSSYANSQTIAPLITGDHSGDNQRYWEFIQSDPATASWLDGGPADSSDPVQADPDYVALSPQLGASPASDSYPVAYKGVVNCPEVEPVATCGPANSDTPGGQDNTSNSNLNSVSMMSIQNNYDQAASNVLAGSDPALNTNWITTLTSPRATPGWWGSVGAEPVGQVFMSALNDMPDLAAYGLNFAALCPAGTTDPASTSCVQPSLDSVNAALNSSAATTDTAGLIQVNPPAVSAGAYPLVDVVYAAVPTDQPAAALSDYADFINYAAGQGQTTGSAPGDLPAGYLPLTSSLQAQAQAVVTQLKTLAGAGPSSSAGPSTSDSGANSGAPTQSTSQSATGGSTTGGTGTTSGTGTTGGLANTAGSTTGGAGRTTGGNATGLSGTGATAPAGGGTAATTIEAAPTAQTSSTCATTQAAPPSPSVSGAATEPAGAACPSASVTPFDVVPATAQAAAGNTPGTGVGSVRDVLIIVAIVGAAGALAGGLLRSGRIPWGGRRRVGS